FDTAEERAEYNHGMRIISFADRLGLKKNHVDIQPPDTTLIDLTASEDEILGRMHQKWRYNIRLAEKKGVVVKRYLGNDVNLSQKIDRFYELTKETNARDGNSSHAKEYYLDLIKSSADQIAAGSDVPVVSLYIAEHEGDEIAAIMTLFSKDEAIYLYGASSNHKRNLMPNHLLQWTAMKDAKAYGSKYYDMYGMPPDGEDEHHPMHGLYMFKANFGGHIIHRIGSWDIPFKNIYNLYSTAEKLRAFWYKKVIKKLKGR
ncbi:MAG: peptidoglycan bridge formation glycyltransferase FemA/FemB family protein, partial [Treponema sp.]|nr:peptidoglycan bridge formation glycyltransferase FemA/FemB family protein [Treponema sp.]